MVKDALVEHASMQAPGENPPLWLASRANSSRLHGVDSLLYLPAPRRRWLRRRSAPGCASRPSRRPSCQSVPRTSDSSPAWRMASRIC